MSQSASKKSSSPSQIPPTMSGRKRRGFESGTDHPTSQFMSEITTWTQNSEAARAQVELDLVEDLIQGESISFALNLVGKLADVRGVAQSEILDRLSVYGKTGPRKVSVEQSRSVSPPSERRKNLFPDATAEAKSSSAASALCRMSDTESGGDKPFLPCPRCNDNHGRSQCLHIKPLALKFVNMGWVEYPKGREIDVLRFIDSRFVASGKSRDGNTLYFSINVRIDGRVQNFMHAKTLKGKLNISTGDSGYCDDNTGLKLVITGDEMEICQIAPK